jgi:protoheme IX farnesyltransferase
MLKVIAARRSQCPVANLLSKLRQYWPLIKGLQTGLLLVTGLAGYMSARCPVTHWTTLAGLAGSLFLAISGSTILNMVYDRDIDTKMKRTAHRPLPSDRVNAREALLVGSGLSWLGVAWAFALSPLYGAIVSAGLFFDVVVYTIWLKRRTPWSIVWGGISGGMPVLAGRALGAGRIDLIGVLLALAVLLWIPTHIMTFGIKYADDYRRAGVPVFPNTHGEQFTRAIIGLSTAGAVIVMLLATWRIGLEWGFLRAAFGLGAVLVGFALASALHQSSRLNFALFKMASLYMLGSMGLIMIGV